MIRQRLIFQRFVWFLLIPVGSFMLLAHPGSHSTRPASCFTPDRRLHKGPPPPLRHDQTYAVFVNSLPNERHTGSVETVLTLATDGTAAMHIYRMVNNQSLPGGTLYWYWHIQTGKDPADGSAVVLSGHKHSTMIGAGLLDKDKEWGTISPDGKTLTLFGQGEVTTYTRKYPQI